MIFTIAIFVIALVVLVISSEAVIRAAIKISEYLGVSQLAIAFIIVAVANSLPDFMISVNASMIGKTSLAIGDVLGSSIANICLVLGIAALIRKIKVRREQTIESAELLFLISLIPLVVLSRGILTLAEGLILIILFFLYVFFVIKKRFTLNMKDGITKKQLSGAISIFLLGLLFVFVSSKFVVEEGIVIAGLMGLPDAIIGMTLIAFGTTLPSLAIDFTAIRKGYVALALGDILGSSVVNLTLVLGAAIVINPTTANFSIFLLPIVFLVVANSFLGYNLLKHEGINNKAGLMFLLLYILFIVAGFSSKVLFTPVT
ncbi:MAG: hypothetical protein HYW05_05130 [Candidatus Diapherotrites archaeon]|nr:hypothetical protein [Candidatus Diapherotrites archaeon]